jgi:hypothetical protein
VQEGYAAALDERRLATEMTREALARLRSETAEARAGGAGRKVP